MRTKSPGFYDDIFQVKNMIILIFLSKSIWTLVCFLHKINFNSMNIYNQHSRIIKYYNEIKLIFKNQYVILRLAFITVGSYNIILSVWQTFYLWILSFLNYKLHYEDIFQTDRMLVQ